MMEASLRRLRQFRDRVKSPAARLILLFVIIFISFMGLVELASGVGFSDEVSDFRIPLLIAAALLALLGSLGSFAIEKYQEFSKINRRVKELEGVVDDLEQQKESLLRLMERYKAEAQEDIINKLKRLALVAIMQADWLQKGARIERFRIEESKGEDINSTFDILDRITVMINIGLTDRVMPGISFIVQDPTDSEKYGVIIVKEPFANGSACRITETTHPAFWSEALEASAKGKSCILESPKNVVVPHSPLKEIPAPNARQLLEWLQNIERAEI